MMSRHYNCDWNLPEKLTTWEEVQVALLMDIRLELTKLNRLLNCSNFTSFPRDLRRIAENTKKRKYRRKKVTK